MTAAPAGAPGEPVDLVPPRLRPSPGRVVPRRLLAACLIGAVVLVGGGLGLRRALGRGPTASPGVADNSYPTSVATVVEQPISSQSQESGTLGYTGAVSVVAPSGINQQALDQTQQQLASAQDALAADQTAAADGAAGGNQTITQDQAALSTAQSQMGTDQATENTDCGSLPSGQACNADKQTVAGDQARLTQAQNALANAQQQAKQSSDQSNARLASDESSVQNARSALGTAQAAALNPRTTYTQLPAVGQTITRGQVLYALDGISVPLFYGALVPWRDFELGMSDGSDVGELNANLIALGFGSGLSQGDSFSSATRDAVERWQASIGAPQTGTAALGDAVFEPGALIVTAVTPNVGSPVQPGAAILEATSTTPQVAVNLDTALEAQVKVGDHVTITLPDNRTTPGVVSSVGTVATTSSSSPGGGSGTPTVTVDIQLTNPADAGHLDQAPVEVAITTDSVANALVVPVTSLLAQPGGYVVEVLRRGGAHRLVPVSLGLFDNADGLVQVSGTGLAAGDRVVVPSS